MLGDADCCNKEKKPMQPTLRNAKYGIVGNDNSRQTSGELTPQPVLLRELGIGLKCVLWRLGIALSDRLFYFSIAADLSLGFSYMLDKHSITELFPKPVL